MRVLYIDIDSQRPDHFGCYGYSRRTSPNIDAIAAQGVRFDNVYTSDAPCLPSRTAFYSGRFGIQTGVVGHGATAAQPKVEGEFRGFRDQFGEQGLARMLQKAGLHTAMISPFGQRHSAHWFYASFNEIHNTGMGGAESAEHVMPVVRKWLADNVNKDNWYLHVNFWDPHTPYRVPLEYGNPFEKDPLPKRLQDPAQLERHKKLPGPHTALDLGMYNDENVQRWPRAAARLNNLADLKKWIDGYDTGVKYVDDQVGYIVQQLKQAGVYDDTAIIISADHGENQGELGIYGEHGTADQGTCHIPLIVKWPGGARGKVDGGLHYNVDLAPTLAELLQQPAQAIWDGRSFAETIRSGKDQGREDLVVGQCCHVCQRSVRWDKWVYIRTYHCGFHAFPPEMLFDLQADPYEQNDVAARFPEVCREGAWRLARWHDAQMQKMARQHHNMEDPLWRVVKEDGPMHARHTARHNSPLPKYLKRLEETGRADGAAELRKRFAEFLPQG